MATNKDFNTLDELFKETFENLSDKPSSNGWDMPSDKVWQHVEMQIKKPVSGWKSASYWLLGSFAVVLAIGLYWMSSRPIPSTIPTVDNTNDIPAIAAQTTVLPPATTPIVVEDKTGQEGVKAPTSIKKRIRFKKSLGKVENSVVPVTQPIVEAKQPIEVPITKTSRPIMDESAPFPGSKFNPPNSTEKLREELRQSWKRSLTPLPIRRQTAILELPVSFRQIGDK